MMTAFSYGDMALSEFDVIRTAEPLRYHDGRMFHTTYSLIWVKMLYDTYMFTGNTELLRKCADALGLLIQRFETYIGENGLIETPPDYMFADWLYIDGLSLHHPPKALGQTCLNMFYFGALESAEKVYEALSEKAMANQCKTLLERTRSAINLHLYDKEKELYFEGLNTPTPENLLGTYMPQNVEKRYYRAHANILAAYFGVCDSHLAKKLIRKVMTQPELGECQPYFAHYLFEAVYKNGLREEYTLEIAGRWKPFVAECDKGLAEGFIAPEPTYSFDHSHAWGGSPLYSIPKALLGIDILEAGYRKIRLAPSLLGLEAASVEIPTPFGKISCIMKKGEKIKLNVPQEITVEYIKNSD